MANKFPFLPLSVDAYQSDTGHLTLEEHGAYLTLLMEAWKRKTCSLPDDDQMLARLLRVTPAKWAKLKPTVMEFWTYDGRSRCWVQKRLKKERDYVEKKSRKNSDSARKRWDKTKKRDANGYANAYAPPPPHIEPSQKRETLEVGDTRETPFDEPWSPRVVKGGSDV